MLVAVLAVACCGNKKEAMTTAKAFLQAYYVDLDFNKAPQLSSDASHAAITDQAKMISLNPYAGEETPDIVFVELTVDKDNSNTATCTYTCNRVERTLPLRNFNGKWLIDLGSGTVETGGSSEFMQLSQDNLNGFASATSGEIKYKKRRQGNQ